MFCYLKIIWIATFLPYINGLKLPGSCEDGHYYESSVLDCLPCSKNASLVTSKDGKNLSHCFKTVLRCLGSTLSALLETTFIIGLVGYFYYWSY